MANNDLISRDFEAGTFPYIVLTLREAVQANAATPEQVSDWHKLATWLGCRDGPITKADIERLNEARLAFLRQANGSPFDAARLPDSDICAIFERLAPAAAAIEKMIAQKRQQTQALKPPGKGIDRGVGIAIGSVIGFVIVVLLNLPHHKPVGPEEMGEAVGYSAVPVVVAAVAVIFIKGSSVFRPLTDAFFLASITGGLMLLAAFGAHSGGASGSAPDPANVAATMDAIAAALATWILTAIVTGVLTLFAPKPKSSASQ